MGCGAARTRLADVLGLAAILLVLLDLLRPALLLLPTITAGGDTPCHYPTAVWFHERLLPHLRLHGWYPGASLGHPLLLYYFPLPFLLMSALAPLAGMPVAFKLGTALGVFLLPLLVYSAFRLMRLPFPAPLLGAAAALVFLFVEDNPIWGGTIASTLAGEFAYTYGVGLGVLFLGVLVRAREDGRGPWWPAVTLALTGYAHGYAVLWAGFTAPGVLLGDPHPRRRLLWLLAIAGLAFALDGPALVPLLADWGWTTPYDDAWIDLTARGLAPPLLWPLFLAAGAFLVWTAARRAGGGRIDERMVLLGFGTLVGAALTAAGPTLGVIDVRFAPFAQLSLALLGAAAVGLLLSRAILPDVAALGLLALAVVWADAPSRVLRSWIDWNYSGLEAKELWPAWGRLTETLRGGPGDPRVAVEYSPIHERAGSIRMHETLPFFSGRSGLEGVYNQASTTTHPVYYLASELFASSPNPFRSRTYSSFDPETALARLRLFNVGEIVVLSPRLASALDTRADVVRRALIPPYTLYRLLDPGPGYVEPLAWAPVRSSPRGWPDKAYRWMTRKPPNRAVLVFTDDPRFELAEVDPWAPPPERPLPAGVAVTAAVEPEAIRITTDRPGHPLLVKVSYHPRWRAEGALGPYLASPGLMLVVPTQRQVRLAYAARTWADRLGLALGALAAGGALLAAFRRRGAREGEAVGSPASRGAGDGGRWVASIPLLLVVVLASLRLVPEARTTGDAEALYERASRAFAAERWEDAAEYARHGVAAFRGADPRYGELLCVRGEALLRAGHPREALEAFTTLLEGDAGPRRAQALFSGALAREATGDEGGAARWRRELREQFGDTPWARRLAAAASTSDR